MNIKKNTKYLNTFIKSSQLNFNKLVINLMFFCKKKN